MPTFPPAVVPVVPALVPVPAEFPPPVVPTVPAVPPPLPPAAPVVLPVPEPPLEQETTASDANAKAINPGWFTEPFYCLMLRLDILPAVGVDATARKAMM